MCSYLEFITWAKESRLGVRSLFLKTHSIRADVITVVVYQATSWRVEPGSAVRSLPQPSHFTAQ
jgi:hypothetical protein